MKNFPGAALAVLILAGCDDESPSTSELSDTIQVLKRAHVRDIASALNSAYEEFKRRNFDVCIAFCNYILSREPEYCVAVEFAEDAMKARERIAEGDEFYFSFVMCKVNNWKKLTDADGVLIPYVGGTNGDVLTYPHLGLPKTAEPEPEFPRAPDSVSAIKMD